MRLFMTLTLAFLSGSFALAADSGSDSARKQCEEACVASYDLPGPELKKCILDCRKAAQALSLCRDTLDPAVEDFVRVNGICR